MKNFFRFLLMSLFLATSFSVASCSDDDDDAAANDSIVGTWVWSDDDEDVSLTAQFNSNKTGALIIATDGTSITQSFEYDYQPEDYYIEIIGSELEGEYDVTLTATKLRLKDSGGYWEFTRK